jgi:FlaA1/EpsC-like NDP-sugar epimerase
MKKLFLPLKAVPRWVILLVDLVVTSTSFSLSYFIIKNFQFPEIYRGHFFIYTGFYSLLSLITFFCMRIHTGLIRYSNIHDMMRIFLAVFLVSALYPVAIEYPVTRKLHIESLDIPGVLLINFFISSSLLVLMRAAVKSFYYYILHGSGTEKEPVLVYGSDNEAILIKQAIESGTRNHFHIAGFVDTDRAKVGTYIQQKKVFHINALPVLKYRKNIGKVILMNEQLSANDKKAVIEKCLQAGVKVLTVPPSDQWVCGQLALGQIQELRIEDLLQREPIVINDERISHELNSKRVLITGAAGSIGSEIVRQVLSYEPGMVIMCDQAETHLHEIQLEVEEKYPHIPVKTIIASVRDYNRMQIPFRDYRPHIVFHAAAYKHVPMMEQHPAEAVLTNVMGTKIVADLSVLYQVHKFVMISTDKAVNPTNIMGTSKRIAEMYVQSLGNVINAIPGQFGHEVRTKFITTRFGNVLGSNGSVIPRFRQQIKAGGPVTVTHPEINRYFMTIPEAVQLVMEAATMGEGGEIFVFDMGKPVKIVDLATKMIRLAGLTPHEDIQIVFTGLRPGEKLYEELLNNKETTLPTHHEKIKIARTMPCSANVINEIGELIEMGKQEDNYRMVRKMKELVPDFKSNNSQYEELDRILTSI